MRCSFVCAAVQLITYVALATLGSLTLAGILPASTGGGVAMLTLGAAGLLFQTGQVILSLRKLPAIPVAQLRAVFTEDEFAVIGTLLTLGSKKLLAGKINEKLQKFFTEEEARTLRQESAPQEDPHLYLLNKIIERKQQNPPEADPSV